MYNLVITVILVSVLQTILVENVNLLHLQAIYAYQILVKMVANALCMEIASNAHAHLLISVKNVRKETLAQTNLVVTVVNVLIKMGVVIYAYAVLDLSERIVNSVIHAHQTHVKMELNASLLESLEVSDAIVYLGFKVDYAMKETLVTIMGHVETMVSVFSQ